MPGKKSGGGGSTIDRVARVASHKKKGLLDRMVDRVISEGKDAVSFPIRAAMQMSGQQQQSAERSPFLGRQAKAARMAVESQLPPASGAGLVAFAALGGLDAVGEGGAQAMYRHWGKHGKAGIVPTARVIKLPSGRELVRVSRQPRGVYTDIDEGRRPALGAADRNEDKARYSWTGNTVADTPPLPIMRTPGRADVSYNLKENGRTIGSVSMSGAPEYVSVNEVFLDPQYRGPGRMKDLFSIVLDYADKNPNTGEYKRAIDASLANRGIGKFLDAYRKRDPKLRFSNHLDAQVYSAKKWRNEERASRMWAYEAEQAPRLSVSPREQALSTEAAARIRAALGGNQRRDVMELMRRRPHNAQSDVRDVHVRDDERVSVTLNDGTPWTLDIEDWRMVRNLMNLRNINFTDAQYAYGQILARRREGY